MTPEAKQLVRQRYAEILERDRLGQTIQKGLDLGVADDLLGAQVLATVQHDLLIDVEQRVSELEAEVKQLRELLSARWQAIKPTDN